jgi:transcriptional regulator with XRE-family HTH domain
MPQVKGSDARIRRERRAFGRALRDLRMKRGLTQEELAFSSGYHPTYISVLETGHSSASLHTILSLARGLQTNASLLLRKTVLYL